MKTYSFPNSDDSRKKFSALKLNPPTTFAIFHALRYFSTMQYAEPNIIAEILHDRFDSSIIIYYILFCDESRLSGDNTSSDLHWTYAEWSEIIFHERGVSVEKAVVCFQWCLLESIRKKIPIEEIPLKCEMYYFLSWMNMNDLFFLFETSFRLFYYK